MRKASFVLAALTAMCPRLAPAQGVPTMKVSYSSDGLFSATIKIPPGAERPATNQNTPMCVTLPPGSYSRLWTFTAISDDVSTARSVLTVEREGVMIAPRFELLKPSQTGDAWRATEVSMTGGSVCITALASPSTAPVVWVVTFTGRVQ